MLLGKSGRLSRPLRRPMTSETEATHVDPSSTREGYFAPPSGDKDDRLRELELRYRGIIDQLPAVLFVDSAIASDPMIDVSPSVIDLLGISREQDGVPRGASGRPNGVGP
jgi:PAS domain-containing protein